LGRDGDGELAIEKEPFMRRLCSVLLAAATASTVATAQTAGPQQMAFMTLLSQGYEVRATVMVPLAEQRQNPNNARETYSPMLVTMQKGPSVAVCQFNWNVWANMQKASLEDPRLCDVR
jgi:hypothetical protein